MTTRRRTRTRATRDPKQRAQALLPRGVAVRRVVVAADGSDASRAALALARWMEQIGAWAPEAVTVLEPMPVAMSEIAIAPPPVELQQEVADSLVARIGTQIRRYGGQAWQLAVEFGRAAPTIVKFATTRDASLIVLGLGKHGKIARLFGAETAARVARTSRVPVLAVDAGARGAPRTAVVAMDFGDSSVQAAREALRLLERPARLHLVHVRWAFAGHTGREVEWERTYADGVEIGFVRVIDQLGPQPGVRITSEMKLGSVVETILEAAKTIDADLVAVGSHNHDVLDRVLIGSTPSLLLRAAECSILVAPPAAVPDAT